jgi:hypothetical protein
MKSQGKIKISKRLMDRVVSASSRLEGMSFESAKKDKATINLLKKHIRGFSL